MIYIIGAIIWAISIVVILRFFSVCNSNQTRSKSSSDLRNKIEANSPYNDGWTRDHYDNL